MTKKKNCNRPVRVDTEAKPVVVDWIAVTLTVLAAPLDKIFIVEKNTITNFIYLIIVTVPTVGAQTS